MDTSATIEKKILAILINSHTARNQTLIQIRNDDFLVNQNKIIFQAIFDLAATNQKDFDLTLLANYLKNQKKLTEIEINNYLTEIAESFVSDRFLGQYLKELLNNSTCYQIKKQLEKWNKLLVAKNTNPEKILKKIHLEVSKLDEFYWRNQQALQPLRQVVDQVVQEWKTFQTETSSITCTTGFQTLDEKTHGFQKGDLIILAARPSMGKTALALKIAISNSLDYQAKNEGDVIIFSLEMSSYQLVQRVLRTHVSSINLRYLKETDYQKITDFSQKLASTNIFIDTSMSIDVMSIAFKLRTWAQKRPIKLVIIDYLQLLKPVLFQKFDNRNLEVSHWTRILKEIARELAIPILCVSQLSRYVEKREDKRPVLSDLRDSGSIEQDADLVLFLYREDYYQKKPLINEEVETATNKFEPSRAEIIIAKHRNGPTGTMEVMFIPAKTTFYEINE